MKKNSFFFSILVFAVILSCNSVKQAITFKEDYGFHRDKIYNSDFTEIARGFQLGEEMIFVKESQAYATRGFIHWQGKTVDKYGEEMPYVNLYEVDSILGDDEKFSGHFLCTSDERGFFKIKSLKKSCKGFYFDYPGFLGTMFYLNKN